MRRFLVVPRKADGRLGMTKRISIQACHSEPEPLARARNLMSHPRARAMFGLTIPQLTWGLLNEVYE